MHVCFFPKYQFDIQLSNPVFWSQYWDDSVIAGNGISKETFWHALGQKQYELCSEKTTCYEFASTEAFSNNIYIDKQNRIWIIFQT